MIIMANEIYDKNTFIKMLQKCIPDDNFVVMTTIQDGITEAAAKDKKGNWKRNKRISFGFRPICFKRPEDIGDVMDSVAIALILCKKDILSDEIKNQIEKNKDTPNAFVNIG